MDVPEKIKIPLFPLHAVLFPGGALPLRIFEPRYLDMVSNCMKNETRIGVVLIKNGNEAGVAAKAHDIGTSSFISYWHKRNDGMLGITLTGEQRFHVLSTEIQPDQLIVAEVELLPAIKEHNNIHNSEQLINLLKRILSQLEPPFSTMKTFYDDMDWVSARLVELLPLPLKEKQSMLVMKNVCDRVKHLQPLLVGMELL